MKIELYVGVYALYRLLNRDYAGIPILYGDEQQYQNQFLNRLAWRMSPATGALSHGSCHLLQMTTVVLRC